MKAVGNSLDVRVVKTRQQLRDATLLLAESEPIEDISVAAICRVAGINRATFYRHADSPTDVLWSALLEDLDAVRQIFLTEISENDLSMIDIWNLVTRKTIAHVHRFQKVYQLGWSNVASGSLENLFRQHVEHSMLQLFHSMPRILPVGEAENRKFVEVATAASLAASLTAILRAWINAPKSTDSAYQEAVLLSLPHWILEVGSAPKSSLKPFGDKVNK